MRCPNCCGSGSYFTDTDLGTPTWVPCEECGGKGYVVSLVDEQKPLADPELHVHSD